MAGNVHTSADLMVIMSNHYYVVRHWLQSHFKIKLIKIRP